MSEATFTQGMAKLQTIVNNLKHSYEMLHKVLQSAAVIEYEKKLYEIQMQTGKTIKETEALGKQFQELAKQGKYSTQEISEMAAELTKTATTAGMSNEKLNDTIDMWQKRFPHAAGESMKALQGLTAAFKGMSGAFATMKIGDATNEFMTMRMAMEGNIDGIQQMNQLLVGGKAGLMPTGMAKRGRDVAVSEAQLRYSQKMSGAAQTVYGGEAGIMNNAGQGVIAGGMAGQALGALQSLGQSLGIGKKKSSGQAGAGVSGEGGEDGTKVFVTNWPDNLGGGGGGGIGNFLGNFLGNKFKGLGNLAKMIPMGPMAALAGGAALTGAALWASTKMMNRHPAGDVMRASYAKNGMPGGGAGGAESAAAATVVEENKQKEINKALGYRVFLLNQVRELNDQAASQSEKELAITNITGAHWTTRIGLGQKLVEQSAAQVDSSKQVLAMEEKVLARARENLEKVKSDPKATADEKFAAENMHNQQMLAVGKARLDLTEKQGNAEQKIIDKMKIEYDGKLKMLSFQERNIASAERMAKATYMPPGAQQELGMQGIAIVEKKLSAQRNLTKQLEAQTAIAVDGATTVEEKEKARLKYAEQIADSKSKEGELQADIADKANYIRRTWMEQFTETMMGGESGTYLMPGSSALSGLQEKGAAFSPFDDANRGGGRGTYGDIMGQFDPALQESRTAAERGIMDSASGKFVTALDEFSNRLIKQLSNAVQGQ